MTTPNTQITMSRKHNKGMWEYLEKIGILETGTDEEIKLAKKAYRKEYLLQYKRDQRKKQPEFTVNFPKTGQYTYHAIKSVAQRHHMSPTAFIQKAVIGYLNKRYIVPNSDQVAKLEQLLTDCLNEIKTLVKIKDKYWFEKESKMESIEKKIEKLEHDISQIFRNPPLINNDYQDQDIQKTCLQETA